MIRCITFFLILLMMSPLWAGGESTCSYSEQTVWVKDPMYSPGSVTNVYNMEITSKFYPEYVVGYSTLGQYLSVYLIAPRPVRDYDGRIRIISNTNCTSSTETSTWYTPVDGQYDDVTIDHVGDYSVLFSWDDSSSPAELNEPPAYRMLSFCFWTTSYRGKPGDAIIPGDILRNGETYTNKTIYFGKTTNVIQLNQILSGAGISVTSGSDMDQKVWSKLVCFTGATTELDTPIPIQDQVSILTTSTVNSCIPGIYPVTFKWYDRATVDFTVDEADSVEKTIYIAIVGVELEKPSGTVTTGVALNNRINCKAKLTPAVVATQGGTYVWSMISNGGQGAFSVSQTSVNTTDFYGRGVGRVNIRVSYSLEGMTSNSKYSPIDVFTISLGELSFTDDQTIQTDTTIIVDPVWGNDVNKPVCYMVGESVKVDAKFAASSTNAAIVYVQPFYSGTTILAFNEKSQTFTSPTTDVIGFVSQTTLPGTVGVTTYQYTWKYSTDTEHWEIAGTSGPHKIYRVFSTPQAPMSTPWTEVLDKACVWASEKSTQAAIAYSIVSSLYNSGVKYDGSNHYTDTTTAGSSIFYLRPLLREFAPSLQMDCRDFSNFTYVLSNSLGLNMPCRWLKATMGGIYTNYIKPAKGFDTRINWSYHQIAYYNGNVCDASLMYDSDSNPGSTPNVWKLAGGDISYDTYCTALTTTALSYINTICNISESENTPF